MDLLTVPEAAKILGISRAAVYTAIREKRLKSVTVLGKIGIPRNELKAYKPMQVRVQSGRRSAVSKKRRLGRTPARRK